MPMKRKAADSRTDAQANEDSDPVLERGNNAKRAKLSELSVTTIQDLPIDIGEMKDLPIHIVERILVRAVTTEVKNMKLTKDVWKKKADLVINRLRTTCRQWNGILSTTCFRQEVRRILDDTAQETIHLDILHQFPTQFFVFDLTTLSDQMFMLSIPDDDQWNSMDYVINVCKLNNAAMVVTNVIPLPVTRLPWGLAACSTSNCLYVLNVEFPCSSVLRITKPGALEYNVATWIGDLRSPLHVLSVTATGGVIVASSSRTTKSQSISLYDVDGTLEHTIQLPNDTSGLGCLQNVMQIPNGNLVVACSSDQCGPMLAEIDKSGTVVRRYQTKLNRDADATFADVYGRVWVTDWSDRIEIVDSELHLLFSNGPQLPDRVRPYSSKVHYDRERNEIVRIYRPKDGCEENTVLTVIRVTEK